MLRGGKASRGRCVMGVTGVDVAGHRRRTKLLKEV